MVKSAVHCTFHFCGLTHLGFEIEQEGVEVLPDARVGHSLKRD